MHERPSDGDSGFVYAARLPGTGALSTWADLQIPDEAPPLWVHMDRTKDDAQRWLREASGLDPLITESLLADETRPGAQPFKDGLMVIFRGMNLNPGVDIDEMLAIRMWISPTFVVTLRQHRMQAIAAIREKTEEGQGPATAGAFLAEVAAGLASRLAPTVSNLEELLDDIEDSMLDTEFDNGQMRSTLATIRRQAITYRRYLVPKREAILSLLSLQPHMLSQRDLAMLRVAGEQVARAAEALEEIRDRAAVTMEEIRARHEARMSRTLYLLTIVATIALPLGLITGLFGINVGGMPWVQSGAGFIIVCLVMLLIAGTEFAIFKVMKWI